MRIGVDAREICNRPAGKGQYLLRLLTAWAHLPEVTLILCIEEGQTLPVQFKDSEVLKEKGGLLWHFRIAKRLKSENIDVYFAALSYLSALVNPVPTVTVVHDLAVFRLPKLSHNRKARIIEKISLRPTVQKSAILVTVSESTKKDLLEIGKANAQKVKVVYPAAMSETGMEKPLPFSARKKYFLFTGTLEPRKNITAILKAYAALPSGLKKEYRLKFAGKPGWGGEDYPALAKELGIGAHVDFLGYVSDQDLLTLFKEASVFMYPSLYEGFGLPVIEAMAMGTPVITSSTSSLPEVVGPKGMVCDPNDSEAMATYIKKLLGDEKFYNDQSNYLWERSQTFSWERSARAILEILKVVSA